MKSALASPATLAWGPLESAGPVLVWLIVLTFIFAECGGLIIGLFLPGDSLLITAGVVLANQSHPIEAFALSVATTLAAIGGSEIGYHVGKKAGTKVLAREGGKVLNRKNLDRAQGFLERYGFLAILASRWLPWVRTLTPMIAGAARMSPRKFAWASVISAATWAPTLILLGYFAAGLLARYRWLETTALVVVLVLFVGGTALGLVRYRQEMRKPVHQNGSRDQDGTQD